MVNHVVPQLYFRLPLAELVFYCSSLIVHGPTLWSGNSFEY